MASTIIKLHHRELRAFATDFLGPSLCAEQCGGVRRVEARTCSCMACARLHRQLLRPLKTT
eukprot:274333-Pyramimonas_sp.AAC.1